jgi:hypothetical protein
MGFSLPRVSGCRPIMVDLEQAFLDLLQSWYHYGLLVPVIPPLFSDAILCLPFSEDCRILLSLLLLLDFLFYCHRSDESDEEMVRKGYRLDLFPF